MAKKGDKVKVIIECTEAREAGVPPSRYYTTKNKKKHPDKLKMNKYNKYMKKVTEHIEIK
jgi:large subunit ribosomal protein L33